MKTMQNCDPKFKILTISFLMLLGFFGLAKTSLAVTPAISNVSGTVATGQTLTISGANMMDEDKMNWDSFFVNHPNASGFEGSSRIADGYDESNGGSYDADIKLMGNQSIKFHAEGSLCGPSTPCGEYNYVSADNGDSRDLWARVYARWNLLSGSWPDSHIKMLYDMSGSAYYQPCHSIDGSPPTCMLLQGYLPDAGEDVYASVPSVPDGGQLQYNKWYEFEFHLKNNGPLLLEAWMDGIQLFNETPTQLSDVTYFLFGIINIGTSHLFSLDHWMDGLALSSTRVYPASTIEISNNATYGQGTKVYQEPLYLSDGSVQIKSDLAGLGSGPYYLFVTNNRQETSAAYNLSGDGGDTVPPSAPSGLIVN